MEDGAVGVRGSMVEALAISGEVEWRWPQAWGGRSSGCVPGRWTFIVSRSSLSKISSELVSTAAHQRLRARSSSVSWMSVPGGGFLRRRRRWRSRVQAVLEDEDGLRQQRFSLYFLCFF